MKHIRKFNEGKDDDFDIEYIKTCFAELIDDFEVTMEQKHLLSGKLFKITITLPRLNGRISLNGESTIRASWGLENSLKTLIQNSKDLTKILELCDISINRLSDEYPEYKIGYNEIDDDLKTRVYYRTKSDTDTPYLTIIIAK